MNKSSDNLPQSNKADSTCRNIRSYFKTYCESTSIHGFKYFGEKRTVFEKGWWVVVFIICLSFCSYMIYLIYEKYDTSPVIVTFSTRETDIQKIPFPAVTICPETKSVKSIFNYTKVIQKKLQNLTLTQTENKYFQYMSTLCDLDTDLTDEDFDKAMQSEMKNNTFSATDFMATLEEMKPTLSNDSIIISCKYISSDINCVSDLVPVVTDEGLCYSFNIMDRTEIFSDLVKHYKDYYSVNYDNIGTWNIESGYEKGFEALRAYPIRAFLAGASNGLTIRFATQNRDLDYVCKQIQGFKVVIHAPFRVPKLKQEYFRLPLDQMVIATIQPVMITTSEKVKSFDVKKRQCYFSTERKLKYFKFYSHLECLTNYTLANCGCVQIFMPREESTEICGPLKQRCLKDAEDEAFTDEIFEKLADELGVPDNDLHIDMNKIGNRSICGCLPACTDISYSSQISQGNWDWREQFRLINKKGYDTEIHLSSLTVYFKYNHFITSERQELYGTTDFVANFGGLLGLFTGFSILSLMEIIYFLTVRICGNIKLFGRWNGEE